MDDLWIVCLKYLKNSKIFLLNVMWVGMKFFGGVWIFCLYVKEGLRFVSLFSFFWVSLFIGIGFLLILILGVFGRE